jgi:hypothetical protein
MRAVALDPKPNTLLDHLGVLSAILEIPLIVTEEKTYELALSLYPQLNPILKDPREILPPYLAEQFDLLFVTSKRCAIEMYPYFPLFHNKQMRIVYCPHGNSDKGHSFTKELHADEDISLVYGNHMIDLLKDTGMFDRIRHTVITGNYRKSFYEKNQDFYLKAAKKRVFPKLDPKKKTLFYCPTWSNRENPSSFFDACGLLVRQITPSFNLLIKPHPYLYEKNPAETTQIVERYKDHPQVLFLEDFPPIYPLLALSDAYIGDFSSIGYDFLSFDKPMYFFNTSSDRGSFLHQAGMTISKENKENIFDWIEKSFEKNQREFSSLRKKLYNYTFGAEKSWEALKNDIFLTTV